MTYPLLPPAAATRNSRTSRVVYDQPKGRGKLRYSSQVHRP